MILAGSISAQTSISKVWVADNRDGTYRNPILHADYSDPDVIRVGDDFYLVASSFNAAPGLPILHSRDLVNWTIIGHALPRQQPFDVYSKPPHGNGVMVFDGHEHDPTVEGPKLYKRNGYYYIFAPAGGVESGWQLTLRSKNIFGPYERRVVLAQGKTNINGPHQGAWVDTQSGESWFIHFQDKGPYGRVVHLQPMKWVNDWPAIGTNQNNDGEGE